MSKPGSGKTSKQQFEISWEDFGREPESAPNPAYPNGVDLDASARRQPTCIALLPYPARRCGGYTARCRICGASAGCTTAGRLDDPRSIKIACRPPTRA